MSTPVTVKMPLAKETKRMYKFETDDEEVPFSNLYVRKDLFNGQEKPRAITVTVDVAK